MPRNAPPESLLAMDPGLREAGVAYFEDGVLRWATVARNTERKARGPTAWVAMAAEVRALVPLAPQVMVVEVPQVYGGFRGPIRGGNPMDLLELAGVDGAVVTAVSPGTIFAYLPREWKGQTPKQIHNDRVLAALNPEETARITDVGKTLQHNVTDAIGLGLKHLGRMP